MINGTERWYVVQSQPNAELKAAAHLNRQGFTTYLPRYMKRRRHARRVEDVHSEALCFAELSRIPDAVQRRVEGEQYAAEIARLQFANEV